MENSPYELMTQTLQKHIQGFEIWHIADYLEQAEKQFSAKLVEREADGGLILQLKNSKRHIGAVYFGNTLAEKMCNMFFHFIQFHYGTVANGKFTANLNFETTTQKPLFT
jgi:hypothetical protein